LKHEPRMGPTDIVRISKAATRSSHERLVAIDHELVRAKAEHSRDNPRRREIHNFHAHDDATLQRMLNAVQPGSYVTPHRHQQVPKAEAFIVLQGGVGFVVFHDEGRPDEAAFVHVARSAGVIGVDCRAGVWHTFFALEPDTVVFEVKPGPYDARVDKEFAPWAPVEGDPRSFLYLAALEDRFRAALDLPRLAWEPDR